MASPRAIRQLLAILAESFGGDVTAEKAVVYHDALSDLTDDEVGYAARFAQRNWEGRFIPPPAVLRNAVGVNAPAFDDAALIDEIQRLGEYSPVGMRWPSVRAVRHALGGGIAEAYSRAGARSLFSDNETTRAIARRDFMTALTGIVRERGLEAIALPAAAESARLGAGSKALPSADRGSVVEPRGSMGTPSAPQPMNPNVVTANDGKKRSWRDVLSDPSYKPTEADYAERRRCMGHN